MVADLEIKKKAMEKLTETKDGSFILVNEIKFQTYAASRHSCFPLTNIFVPRGTRSS